MENNKEEYIDCPFCKCGLDFDLIGLKSHIVNGDCVVFNEIEDISRI